jgi:hypothetical protein
MTETILSQNTAAVCPVLNSMEHRNVVTRLRLRTSRPRRPHLVYLRHRRLERHRLFDGAAMTDPANRAQAQRIYEIAVKHLQTVQGCVDHLHALDATNQLKLLTGRLQRLAFRAEPAPRDMTDQ